jgi:hypothetical protein
MAYEVCGIKMANQPIGRDTGGSSFPAAAYQNGTTSATIATTITTGGTSGYLVAWVLCAYSEPDDYTLSVASSGLTWTKAIEQSDIDGHRAAVFTAPYSSKLTSHLVTATISDTTTGNWVTLVVDAIVNTGGPGNTAGDGSPNGTPDTDPRTVTVSSTGGTSGSWMMAGLVSRNSLVVLPPDANNRNDYGEYPGTAGATFQILRFINPELVISGSATMAVTGTIPSGEWQMVGLEMKGA